MQTFRDMDQFLRDRDFSREAVEEVIDAALKAAERYEGQRPGCRDRALAFAVAARERYQFSDYCDAHASAAEDLLDAEAYQMTAQQYIQYAREQVGRLLEEISFLERSIYGMPLGVL